MWPLILDLLYLLAAICYLPILLYQMIALKKNRRGWSERFGAVPTRSGNRHCIWLHAVSLGEVNATRSLVAELQRRLPDHDIVISATTDTGYAAARRAYPDRIVFRYPLDFSLVVRRALRRIRPAAIILMELEVWPNLLAIAARRGVPVCVANGRVTEGKSMRRFRLPVVRSVARAMFSRMAVVAAQDEVYARRFVELGAPADRVHVAGNLKFDTVDLADRVAGDDALAAAMGIDRAAPLIVAGSTGPGEEEHLLDAFASLRADVPGLQLAIIPRKPERFDEVAALIVRRGHLCRRRSSLPDALHDDPRPSKEPRPSEEPRPSGRHGRSAPASRATILPPAGSNSPSPPPPEAAVVHLGDTMGELRKFYSLASVAFVGRTLVPLGGSDLMEAAALGKPVCFGPYVENFADAAEKLLAAGAALKIDGPAALVPALLGLLTNTGRSAHVGRAAREVIRANMGATTRTADLICARLANAH